MGRKLGLRSMQPCFANCSPLGSTVKLHSVEKQGRKKNGSKDLLICGTFRPLTFGFRDLSFHLPTSPSFPPTINLRYIFQNPIFVLVFLLGDFLSHACSKPCSGLYYRLKNCLVRRIPLFIDESSLEFSEQRLYSFSLCILLSAFLWR